MGESQSKLGAEVVGRDGEGEDPALEVALDHDLEEGLVDPVDLLLVVAVAGVELDAADDGLLVLHVLGDGPVEGQVGEGRLPAPAAGDVEAEDELLHVLLDVLVAEVVVADEGGEEGVDAREGLGPGELGLHGADVVDHVEGQRVEVLGRVGVDLVRDVAEALADEVLEGPAGAVADDGVAQVVDVELALLVGPLGPLGVDLVEGEVRQDLAGDAGVEAGEAHDALVRVLADLPVGVAEVVLDQPLEVEPDPLGLADALVLLAVEDVGLGDVVVALLHEDHFDDVLDLLDGRDRVAAELLLDHEADDVGGRLGDGPVGDALRLHRLEDGVGDLVLVEIRDRSVPLLDPADRADHRVPPPSSPPAHKPGNSAGNVLKSTLPETMAKLKSLSALIPYLVEPFRGKYQMLYFPSRLYTPLEKACQGLFRRFF